MGDQPATLVPEDRELVRRCLDAAANGPFFPDWEFETLFGLSRSDVRSVLACWTDFTASPLQDQAIVNALNHLIGYPHGEVEAWDRMIGATPAEVEAVLVKWLGSFDPSAAGYVGRMR